MKLVIFGLSINSSWGNGHATLRARAVPRARRTRARTRIEHTMMELSKAQKMAPEKDAACSQLNSEFDPASHIKEKLSTE
jgi:hypothetical protein